MKNRTQWRHPQKHRIPHSLWGWLTDNGSLTRQLRQAVGEAFNVTLLSSAWQCPTADEARLLQQRDKKRTYQREVYLNNADQPLVYARTVVPLATYHAMRYRFDALGNRPLGEMLFNEPSLQRGEIEVACLQSGDDLYDSACRALSEPPPQLWGRRSCFYIEGKRLLVNEIFLPADLWSEHIS